MTDTIIWADKLPDIIKKWILIVPMIFAFVGGGTGIYQTYAKGVAMEAAEVDKNKAVHEVATAFQTVIDPPKSTSSLSRKNARDIMMLQRWHP